jgi:hypothetical protein
MSQFREDWPNGGRRLMKNESIENGSCLNEEIQLLKEWVKSTPPEQVAYGIIKTYCDPRFEATSDMRALFGTWIVNTTEAKEKALEKYFNDICGEQTPQELLNEAQVMWSELAARIGIATSRPLTE